MKIKLYINPDSLNMFLEVYKVLKGLDIENDYVFNPHDIVYQETFNSQYVEILIEVEEYLKFKYKYHSFKK